MPDSQADTLLPARFADWFASRSWSARPHQLEMIEADRAGEDALLIAPTGGGISNKPAATIKAPIKIRREIEKNRDTKALGTLLRKRGSL